MAEESTKMTLRLEADLKQQADELFRDLGMDLSTAINVFIHQAVREGKIPFEISLNQNRLEEEPAEHDFEKDYEDLNDLFKALKEN